MNAGGATASSSSGGALLIAAQPAKREREWEATDADDTVSSKDGDDDADWNEGSGEKTGASATKKARKPPKTVRQSLEEMAAGTPPSSAKPPVKKFVSRLCGGANASRRVVGGGAGS